MLTVSKLTGTSAAILAYAEGRAEKLRGDYYLSSAEASPERAQVIWSPELQGNREAGLQGDVDRQAFDRVMAGQDPRTGEQVITAHLRRRRDLADPATRESAYAHAESLGLPVRRRRPLSRDQALALRGATTLEEARVVLRGARRAAEQSGGPSVTQRVSGIDLTFSSPKSVSLLWGLTRDPELRRGLEQAHTLAARRALRELEARALVGRARQGGQRVRVPLQWVGIEAVHTTARLSEQGAKNGRPPDPDLHTHTVVANMGWDPQAQKWRAVDAGVLLHVRSLGDGVYLTELASQLLSLGLRVVPNTGRDGRYLEVAGILPAWCEAFSQRAHEVRRARELLGIETDVPARALAPATRRGKGGEQAGDHTEAWRAQLEERFGEDALARVDRLAAERSPSATQRTQPLAERERALAARIFGPEGLTAHEATHTQVAVEATAWHLNGGRLSTEEMGAFVPRLLAGGRLVALDNGRYTTQDLLREEVAVERAALQLLRSQGRGGQRGPAAGAGEEGEGGLEAAIGRAVAQLERETGVALDPEQRAAVRLLVDPGRRLSLLGGRAGTGKTTTLRAARLVWEAEGREVVVLSVAARTAQRSAREIGAEKGMTFEAFCPPLRPGDWFPNTAPGLVVVVDEAAMADTHRLHSLLQRTGSQRGGGPTLVLLGDERQLQSVGAGGGWLRLKEHAQEVGGYAELSRVQRQRREWEKDALDELRSGRGGAAIARYLAHDRIRICDTRPDARQQTAEAWNQARLAGAARGQPISDYVMVAATREDVQVLNQWAQGLRRQAGELGEGLELRDQQGSREVFGGDRVRLEARLDAEHPNGIRGEVRAASEISLLVRWDGGEPDTLYRPREHEAEGEGGRQPLELDYAGTAQRSQGQTAEMAFVLPGPQQGLEGLYSALSRAREETTVFLDRQSWSERRSELSSPERETVSQAEVVSRLVQSAERPELKLGALDQAGGAREQGAREKLLAYERQVAQTAHLAAGQRRRDPMDLPIVRPERDRILPPRQRNRDEERHREQERRAREAHERYQHEQSRERGPHAGY